MVVVALHRFALIFLLLTSANSFAEEAPVQPRFAISPTIDLSKLEKLGAADVSVVKNGSRYESDASAVIVADINALLYVSLDYDRYAEWSMPGVESSQQLSAPGPSVYVWTSMSSMGQSSQHFLKVDVRQPLQVAKAVGLEWHLFHPAADMSAGLPDKPLFRHLDGSWYLEPLPGGKLYVRYFLSGELDTWIPDFLIRGLVTHEFRDGVQDVIKVLSHQAQIAKP